MPKDLAVFIDSGALDRVFWMVVSVFLIAEIIGWARKRKKERRAQWALMQWLTNSNGLITAEEEMKMWQVLKLDFKDFILPVYVLAGVSFAVYYSHWCKGWQIWATILTAYVSLYVSVIWAFATLKYFACQEKRAGCKPG